MRNNHIIIVFTLLVSISIFCASCEDWLDVNPKSEVKSEELLKTIDVVVSDHNMMVAECKMYGRSEKGKKEVEVERCKVGRLR